MRARHRHRVSAALLLAGLVAAPAAPRAQQAAGTVVLEAPRPRQGYYIATGLHGVASNNRENGRDLGVGTGSGFTLRLGQLLTRRFGLGLQIDSGGAKKGSDQSTLFGLALATQWELAPDLIPNLSAHASIGLGVASITDTSDPDADLRGAFGTSYGLGLSYDWFFTRRLTGGWALTPTVQARFIPGEEVKALYALFGLEISYWTGLPRNQLDLQGPDAFKRE